MSEQQKEIQITIDDKTSAGVYSNFAMISHSDNEFLMDFILLHPPTGRTNSRVVMTPAHAKRFLQALNENIKIFEGKFGQIKESQDPGNLKIQIGKN